MKRGRVLVKRNQVKSLLGEDRVREKSDTIEKAKAGIWLVANGRAWSLLGRRSGWCGTLGALRLLEEGFSMKLGIFLSRSTMFLNDSLNIALIQPVGNEGGSEHCGRLIVSRLHSIEGTIKNGVVLSLCSFQLIQIGRLLVRSRLFLGNFINLVLIHSIIAASLIDLGVLLRKGGNLRKISSYHTFNVADFGGRQTDLLNLGGERALNLVDRVLEKRTNVIVDGVKRV